MIAGIIGFVVGVLVTILILSLAKAADEEWFR